ncbi:hypothetical protein BDB01DRAFT_855630 [Pilobolus umbonatus]|nr:hypothetical protein BDB01DRAFT_855630 [Pilobolus umbonatus]
MNYNLPVNVSPRPGSSLMYDDLSHSMKFAFSFYPTKSLLYIMEMPSRLCKCITVNRKDVDYNQDSFLKL